MKEAVELALETTATQKAISKAHRVSEAYVTKVKYQNGDKEVGLDQFYPKNGRPPVLHDTAVAGLKDFLEDWPTARLDESCDFIFEEYGLSVSTSTVSRVLSKENITHKRITRVNARRDEEWITAFMAEMADYTAEQIVAVDESAANERTRDRKFGWSLRGVPCRVRLPGRRTERWSILPALTVDGWLDWELF